MERAEKSGTESELPFVRRVLTVFGLAALASAAWALADILLLIFGSVLVAVLLRAIADPLMAYVRIPERGALILAVVLVISLPAAAGIFLGPELSREMSGLYDGLPKAFARVAEVLQLGSFTQPCKASCGQQAIILFAIGAPYGNPTDICASSRQLTSRRVKLRKNLFFSAI